MAGMMLLVPSSLLELPQVAVPTTTETPWTMSCEFLCNVYCKSYYSESPLQTPSVLHIQHLLQINVKNNWLISNKQMAPRFFFIFLRPIKLRLFSSIYIHCDIKTLEVLKIQQLKTWCNKYTPWRKDLRSHWNCQRCYSKINVPAWTRN